MKTLFPLALVALTGSAFAQSSDRILIRENEVLSVKFDSSINAKSTRRGDRFTATIDGDRYLPQGTKLIGRVANIQRKDGDQKAFADLEFTEIELPNGRKVDIDAYPVPLNDRTVRRDRNGRMEAKKATRRDNVVIGSTVGGLILGTIFKKPFEGTVIGALAGILVAETDALNTNGELIVDKGQKMGAAFEREVSLDWRDGGYRGDDRGDWDSRDNGDIDRDRDRRDQDQDTRGDVDRRSILIEFDNQELRFSGNRAPYRDGSTVMVPLAEMADQLGLEVSRTSGKIFFLEDEENVLKLEQNRSEARLNSKRISLPRAIVEKDGITYAPIEAFAAMKRDALYVNGTRVVNRT